MTLTAPPSTRSPTVFSATAFAPALARPVEVDQVPPGASARLVLGRGWIMH